MNNKDEMIYKIDAIIDYLKANNGLNYKIYNYCCPSENMEPDSNIVEYAKDIKYFIENMDKENKNMDLPY